MRKLFEGAKHAAIYSKHRPKSAPEIAVKAVEYMNEGREEKRTVFDLAVDIGCGNGQSTAMFAPYFNEILGVDPSENQIKHAQSNNTHPAKISYKVAAAESIPVSDHSVDLIASGQAIHWADFDRFFAECRRVLKPNGCVVLHGYNTPRLSRTDQLDQVADEFAEEFFKGCIWNERISHVRDGYRQLFDLVPTQNKMRDANVSDVIHRGKLIDALQYYQTWSGYQEYKKQKADADRDDILSALAQKLKKHWKVESSADEEIDVIITYPFFMILSKRP